MGDATKIGDPHEDEGVVFDIELDDEQRTLPPTYSENTGGVIATCHGIEDVWPPTQHQAQAPQYPSTPPSLPSHTDEEPSKQDSPPLLSDPRTPPRSLSTAFSAWCRNKLPTGDYVSFQAHDLALLSPTSLRTDSTLQERLFRDRVVERERDSGFTSSFWSGDEGYDLQVIDLDFLGDEPVMSGALDAEDPRCEICAVPGDVGSGAVESLTDAGVLAL